MVSFFFLFWSQIKIAFIFVIKEMTLIKISHNMKSSEEESENYPK